MAKFFTEEQAEQAFREKSAGVTQDDVQDILHKESSVLGKARGPLEKFAEDMRLLFSVIKDYASGAYTEVPWTTVAAIIGTLIYVLSPIDLIPDFIPVIGLLDDAAVLAICLNAIHTDLQNYKLWKDNSVIRERLITGETVMIADTEIVENSLEEEKAAIKVPEGKLAANGISSLRDALASGQPIEVGQDGSIIPEETGDDPDERDNENAIKVPPGKLAVSSFYWYENDPQLLVEEKKAMTRFFPDFQLKKLNDGKLYWEGFLKPLKKRWKVAAIYEHDHPHNHNTFGTSVNIYLLEPSIESLLKKHPHIPHILQDGEGNLFLCTARQEDVTAGKRVITTAASTLSWAAKWLISYELWEKGELPEFDEHGVI